MKYLFKTILPAIFIILFSSLTIQAADVDYTLYEQVLKGCVNDKLINYEQLIENRTPLDKFVMEIGRVTYEQISGMTEDERLAFWINAFNALTLQAVIDGYPVMTTNDIEGFTTRKWKVAGRIVTLDHIRLQMIGDELHEPLAFLATTNGSAGSPALQVKPYRGAGLREKLQEMARKFVNDGNNVAVMKSSKTVEVHQLFGWFVKTFVEKYGSIEKFKDNEARTAATLNFIWTYATPELKADLETTPIWKIEFKQYLWLINADKRPPVKGSAKIKEPTK